MKTASKVFLVLGAIANIIGLIITIVFCVLFALGAATNILQQIGVDPEVFALGNTMLATIFGIVAGIELIVFIVAVSAYKATNKPGAQNGPFIALIVIGVLCVDLFYLLGGIFGVISENN